MRYIKKLPLEDEEKTKRLLSSGWNKLKEPRNISTAILCSLPISFILIVVNGIWFYYFSTVLRDFIHLDNFRIVFQINIKTMIFIIVILLFLFLHEMIHALFIPNIFHSTCTYWGLNGLFGFIYTEEIINKKRYLVISIMPLLILSFLLLAVLSFLGISNWFIIFLGILNAGGSCVDILNMILITTQVPSKGKIISNGFSTYYRLI